MAVGLQFLFRDDGGGSAELVIGGKIANGVTAERALPNCLAIIEKPAAAEDPEVTEPETPETPTTPEEPEVTEPETPSEPDTDVKDKTVTDTSDKTETPTEADDSKPDEDVKTSALMVLLKKLFELLQQFFKA